MGKIRGRASDRRLTDMSAPVSSGIYRPPPVAVPQRYTVALTLEDRLEVKLERYKGLIVNFAITQIVVEGDDDHHVARIDCSHGTIHRHQYNRLGEDLYKDVQKAREIERIPVDNGWEVVHRGYEAAYDALFSEWEQNLQRWRNG